MKHTTNSRLLLGHLLGTVFALAAFVVAIVPATPLLVRMFLPFPTLADSAHLAGRVEIEGEYIVGWRTNTVPRNYIVTASGGRHEFKCGLIGNRIPCSNYKLLNNSQGEVWYHPVFGALQWRFVIGEGKFKGEVEERSIAAREASFREDFDYGRYLGKLMVALVALAISIWQMRSVLRARGGSQKSPQRSN